MNFFKRSVCLFAVAGLLVIFTGCPLTANMGNLFSGTNPDEETTNNTGNMGATARGKDLWGYFDTVSSVYSYANDSAEEFNERCDIVAQVLLRYHNMFDIYYEYSGMNNLCTVNKAAGGEPVQVSPELIEFLLYAKDLYNLTNGKMNVMMGSVLSLWHDSRENASTDPANASIPSLDELDMAAEYVGFEYIEINSENNTVRITDKNARIDVGALGKGYATEKAAQALIDAGVDHYVLNIGGNIRIIGEKTDGSGWKTGIKDPKAPNSNFAAYINIKNTSCVTSGDYERYFMAGGVKYHHIIDGDTNMPARYFSSVTVICADSGLADALSTALFCMSREDGLELIEKIGNVGVIWIDTDGNVYYSDLAQDLVIS